MKTTAILGAGPEVVKKWIEDQFKAGMTWENHGTVWHIDHIIPLACAKSEEEAYKLLHFSNLQPLWAKENQQKSGRVGWFPEGSKTGRLF